MPHDNAPTNFILACFVFASLLLAGCASHHWVQDGKTSDDVAKARAACEQSATPPQDAMYPMRQFPDQRLIAQCMTEQGYKLTPKGERTAP